MNRKINKNQLTCIAMCSMLIDHLGFIIWYIYLEVCTVDGVVLLGDLCPQEGKILYSIYLGMRIIGRVAFPIFALGIVEGFEKTRNRKKYIARMVIFAICSELPYDLLFYDGIEIYSQNIGWLFVLGLITLCVLEKLKERDGLKRKLCMCVTILASMCIAVISRVDYGAGGILFVVCCYLYQEYPKKRFCAGALAILVQVLENSRIQFAAIGAFGIYHFYDKMPSEKKKSSYWWYLFYPGHLIVLKILKNYIV